MAREWTPQQQTCITANDGTLLVSAAAGSGKTSVLVERILRRITRAENPTDVDRLLVVTFTKAAAAEMKQRLGLALREQMALHPDDRRLLRQQMLLPTASISTVDGFCTALLRENFYRLSIPPQFAVAEEADIAVLQQQALRETMEQHYAEPDPAFDTLLSLVNSGRDDRTLHEEILRLYRFVQSHPFPQRWLNEVRAAYRDTRPLAETPVGQWRQAQTEKALATAAQLLQKAKEVCEEDEVLREAYGPSLAESHRAIETLREELPSLDPDTWYARLCAIPFSRLRPAKGVDEWRKVRAKDLRDRVQKEIFGRQLLPLTEDSSAEAADDRAALVPVVDCLCTLCEEFTARYDEKKRDRRLLDFGDLEHLSLSLLITEQEDGTRERTPLARELSDRFDEVMVDEYQDTNAAQDALFWALSHEGRNLFLVGDVKQSIYGFRQAMPEIFVEKRDRFPRFDGTHYPGTVVLGKNFRSRETVTDSVNFLFRQLMTRPLGGIDYNEDEALIPAAAYPPDEGYETELLLVDGDPDVPAVRCEAQAIVRRIAELKETLCITEKGIPRPARYGDFCVLLRSKNKRDRVFSEAFRRAGIPLKTGTSGGFFETYEITVAFSLLQLIDNPLREVPLLSVLFSPVGGFSPDDLAAVRLCAPKEPLFTALRRKAQEASPLGEKAAAFLRQTDRYRLWASTMPTHRLLQRVFEDSDLPALMSARRGGAARRANLRLLEDLARRFDRRGGGLSAFVRYLDRLKNSGKMAPAATADSGEDAVSLLSIHQSKGLEFPVVIVGGLGQKFNRQDQTRRLLLHAQAGIGLMRLEPDTGKLYDTLFRRYVGAAVRDSTAAEELRILYVAMTRAKEKLCLCGCFQNLNKTLASLALQVGESPTLPLPLVSGAGGMGSWVLAGALRHPAGAVLREWAGVSLPFLCEAQTPLTVRRVSPAAEAVSDPTPAAAAPDPTLTQALSARFAYRYPYAALTAVPVKLSASGLAHGTHETVYAALRQPAFLNRTGLTPAERGTALHRFLQLCDETAAAVNPATEIARLQASGRLSAQEAATLSLPQLRAFFDSDLFARMTASKRRLREYSFAVPLSLYEAVPAAGLSLPADAQEEMIVLQGTVDNAFEENGGLILVDYKTDRVQDGAELAARYAPQLRAYARALIKLTGLPVKESWLYSFTLSAAVPCPLPETGPNAAGIPQEVHP